MPGRVARSGSVGGSSHDGRQHTGREPRSVAGRVQPGAGRAGSGAGTAASRTVTGNEAAGSIASGNAASGNKMQSGNVSRDARISSSGTFPRVARQSRSVQGSSIPGMSYGGARDANSSKPVSRRAASGRAASDRGSSGRSVASGRATVPERRPSSSDNADDVGKSSNAGNAAEPATSRRKRSLRAIVSRNRRKNADSDAASKKGGTPKQGRVASSAKRNRMNKSTDGGEQGSGSDLVSPTRRGRRVSVGGVSGTGTSGTGVSRATGFVDARALQSEDLVAKTLRESTGPLGVAARPKVVDFNARVKERRHANTLMVVKRVAITIVFIAAVVGVVWALFFSPLLRLDSAQITVSGANEWVSGSKVESIASAQAGKSLLLVSTNDIETQLAAIPGVSKATATKQYPHGMRVAISAQEPAAMLKTPDGSLTAVDGKGRVLNSVKNASTDGIPVIEVNDVTKSLKSRSVVTAVKVVDSLSDAMRARMSKVTAQTQDSVTTELDNGNYTIIWGNASQMKLKKAVVDKIINDPNVIGDKHSVDVSAPLRPIIK